MDARILKTEGDYEAAVAEIETLMEASEDDSRAIDRLELLALLVQKYEDEHFPVGEVTPVDVLKFVMEQRGLAQKDLAAAFGSAARVSDFLAGRRGLSLSTIIALNRDFHVPFELLIDPNAAERKPRGTSAKRLSRATARRRAVATRKK